MATKFKWSREQWKATSQGHGTLAGRHRKSISRPLENGDGVEVQSLRSIRWARRMIHRINRHDASRILREISTYDLIDEVTARGFNVTRKSLQLVRKTKQVVVQKPAVSALPMAVVRVEAPKPRIVACVDTPVSRTVVYRGADSSTEWHGVHPYAHEYLKRSGSHNHRR